MKRSFLIVPGRLVNSSIGRKGGKRPLDFEVARRPARRSCPSSSSGSTPLCPRGVAFHSTSSCSQEGSASRANANRSKQVTVTLTQHCTASVPDALPSPSVPPLDLDRQATSALVEKLLISTRELMKNARKKTRTNGKSSSSDYHQQGTVAAHQHLIAFSGGVDSSVAAAVVHQCHEAGDVVTAVLGTSPAVPSEQVALAVRMADEIGIGPLVQVPTTEGTDTTYIRNEGQACLSCKTHLYTTLQAIVLAQRNNFGESSATVTGEHSKSSFTLYNGTNADDLTDPTRLGLIAARNFHVQSPLQHLSKDNVRRVARHLGLSNWNYAASPCLRSRLALGVQATAEHLALMAQAERLVREHLGNTVLDVTTNLRCRLLPGNVVCIEIDAPLVAMVEAQDWSMLRDLGRFETVRVRAFRSGSVAQ